MFYQHKETDNIYYVHERCTFKHPDTREWVDGYIYSPVEGDSIMNIKYVRETKDFHLKFKKVDLCFDSNRIEDDDFIDEESLHC